jgi:hypothetical protein
MLTGKYVDAAADPEEVVTDLEGMLQHISELGEQMQTYNSYLRMFEMTEDDMSSLQMVEKEANARYQVGQAPGAATAWLTWPSYASKCWLRLKTAPAMNAGCQNSIWLLACSLGGSSPVSQSTTACI